MILTRSPWPGPWQHLFTVLGRVQTSLAVLSRTQAMWQLCWCRQSLLPCATSTASFCKGLQSSDPSAQVAPSSGSQGHVSLSSIVLSSWPIGIARCHVIYVISLLLHLCLLWLAHSAMLVQYLFFYSSLCSSLSTIFPCNTSIGFTCSAKWFLITISWYALCKFRWKLCWDILKVWYFCLLFCQASLQPATSGSTFLSFRSIRMLCWTSLLLVIYAYLALGPKSANKAVTFIDPCLAFSDLAVTSK